MAVDCFLESIKKHKCFKVVAYYRNLQSAIVMTKSQSMLSSWQAWSKFHSCITVA